jgi:chromosome segregation ATPase|tara:strand:+ start:348 stop:626 length:279 start_codon:yes stop_codon:yes gene_type:complete
MPKQDIHQLEERVLVLIGEFRRLKDENQELSRQVDQLNREKETLVEEQNLSQVAKDRLSKLESLDKKNEKDRKVMRTKIKTLLENLEKFDLA